jgi:cysteine desulfurase
MALTEHRQQIYLDNNAATPLLPEVAETMREAAARFPANPSSQHRAGQAARRALEDARERIGALLGAKTSGLKADRVVFTSGGTEANNLAILGMLAGYKPGHFITSAIEHPSVLGAADELERRGWRVTRIGAEESGMVNIDELVAAFCDDTRLVSIMAANNETGVIQPHGKIAEFCAARCIPLHIDAAHGVGKVSAIFQLWQRSMMSFAAHKFHGPVGIGALVLGHGVTISPQLFGGHQQEAVRPGTESVALAVGMKVALEAAFDEMQPRRLSVTAMRDEFETLIRDSISEAIVIGSESKRLPNTSNIAFPGIDRQAFFLALDMAGVACSTGSACASGSSKPSPVLLAMGLKRELVESALRFSFSHLNTAEETREAARRIINVHKHLSG